MSATNVLAEPPQRESAELLNLLIVDDDRATRELCKQAAQQVHFHTFVVSDALSAYETLEQQPIDVVLLDLKVPGGSGVEVLREIRQRRPQAEVVLITPFATVQSAVQAMRVGAFDYLTKPFQPEELHVLLERVRGHLHILSENRVLREKLRSKSGFGNIIGTAPEMEKLYRIIAKVAMSSHPVLILGEAGTGKELVARAIHSAGPHRDKPFLLVDCASLSAAQLEQELFGYAKGAFAGATRPKPGLLEIGRGGIVFLDEVSALPLEVQSKLLRALQEKEVRPAGSTRRVAIDVRILAASNRDLEAACAQGSFRKDLFFRLAVVNLRIPPLRDRKQDIPLLVGTFLERVARTSGQEYSISDDALRRLLAYDWPGNVRELERCIDRACTLSSGPVVHMSDLPSQLQDVDVSVPAPVSPENGPEIVPLAELEKHAILTTIRVLNGDKLEAARRLGIGKTTLYRKLKEYGTQF